MWGVWQSTVRQHSFDKMTRAPNSLVQVELMKADPQVYQKLTRSLCPSVYGHDSIKQAVLLMLMGGVHKKTHEVWVQRRGE